MKKLTKIVCLITSGLMCTAGAYAQAGGFDIKGHYNGVPEGIVKLMRYNDNNRTQTVIDSVAYSNNTFEIKGKLTAPEMMTLTFEPGDWSCGFLLENSVINVNVDTTDATHYDYTKYGMGKGATISKITVSGSKNQDDYFKYQHDPMLLEYQQDFKEFNKKFNAEKNADAKEKMRSVADSIETLNNKRELYLIDSAIAVNPSSGAAMYSFNQYYISNNAKLSLGALDSTLGRFTGAAKQTVYYANLTKEADNRRALLPGHMAPDFTLLKRDSTKFTLSSTRGKYILIDFWASWCHPCREAIPHWKEVYAKYHSKGFDILSVSDDNVWSNWTKAMDVEKMPWAQVDDEFPIKMMPARVASVYMTHFIPFYVLLDKQGKILAYTDDEKVIDTQLAALLDKY